MYTIPTRLAIRGAGAKVCRINGQVTKKITVVHAAAVKIDGLAAKYSTQDWETVMDVNLRGNFF